jgi:biotin carboxylase
MSTVAIIDAFSSARALAPLFRAAGHDCVHVRSAERANPVYERSYVPGDFVDDITSLGDPTATADALKAHDPLWVIPGIESGVELADVLSEAMGLRTNGSAKSPARRDKHRMAEAVSAAGIPVVEQIVATDLDQLRDWYPGGRVVLKPLRSAGNDGVRFCADLAEASRAFDELIGAASALGSTNAAVLAQEYLVGAEYLVNTVGLDGDHHVTDLWRMHHITANGVPDLGAGARLLPRRGTAQDALVDYTLRVLAALEIANGPTHSEVKLTPDGPRLVETAARMCGADLHVPVHAATGTNQAEWTVRAYTDQKAFRATWALDYELHQHAGLVNMVSPASGTLRAYPRMTELRALPSFHSASLASTPGAPIHRTVDDWTYPLRVYYVHPHDHQVTHDLATTHYLDGPGFYDIV